MLYMQIYAYNCPNYLGQYLGSSVVREHCGRGGREMIRARGFGNCSKSLSPSNIRSYTYEVTPT